MKVAIIGTGYVGLVTGTVFAECGHEVVCIDNNEEKIKVLRDGGVPIYEPGLEEMLARHIASGALSFATDMAEPVENSRVIFIAVGTPPTPSGKADLSYIEQVARQISRHINDYKVIVEKSTVPVRTGEKVKMTIEKNVTEDVEFDVVSNPEFLREGSALEDALNPDRIVIGTTSDRAREVMRELYANFDCPIITTDIKSAEIIKHAANSFLALKISYINAVANICELTGANVEEVAEGMGLDRRIGRNFLYPGIGYGGSCFPKDVDAFEQISGELGYEFHLLREVQKINKDQRKRFIAKIEQELWIVKGKTIGILGLAFKPDTDDMREAPSVEVINELQIQGAKIKAYDPKATENAKMMLKDVEYCSDPYEVARDADCLCLMTEWNEFKEMDLERIRDLMTHPLIMDARNVFDPKEMIRLGVEYRSIGR